MIEITLMFDLTNSGITAIDTTTVVREFSASLGDCQRYIDIMMQALRETSGPLSQSQLTSVTCIPGGKTL